MELSLTVDKNVISNISIEILGNIKVKPIFQTLTFSRHFCKRNQFGWFKWSECQTIAASEFLCKGFIIIIKLLGLYARSVQRGRPYYWSRPTYKQNVFCQLTTAEQWGIGGFICHWRHAERPEYQSMHTKPELVKKIAKRDFVRVLKKVRLSWTNNLLMYIEKMTTNTLMCFKYSFVTQPSATMDNGIVVVNVLQTDRVKRFSHQLTNRAHTFVYATQRIRRKQSSCWSDLCVNLNFIQLT